jgi:hypothetical protein
VPSSTAPAQKGLVPDIDQLVGFFAELKVCIDTNLCDVQTSRSYFEDYARRLYCVHEPFIEWKSASYSKGYGRGLRDIALNATKCI